MDWARNCGGDFQTWTNAVTFGRLQSPLISKETVHEINAFEEQYSPTSLSLFTWGSWKWQDETKVDPRSSRSSARLIVESERRWKASGGECGEGRLDDRRCELGRSRVDSKWMMGDRSHVRVRSQTLKIAGWKASTCEKVRSCPASWSGCVPGGDVHAR